MTAEDADLIAHLAAQGKVRMHVILTSQTAEEVSTFNVVGDLKGSEHPEQSGDRFRPSGFVGPGNRRD